MTTRQARINVLEQIAAQTRDLLPDQRRNFELGVRYGLVQFYFDDHDLGRKVHYEIWPRQHFIELGLHFESDMATNDWLYSSFAQRQSEIDAQLNADPSVPPVLAERWDKGWTRVHCEYPTRGWRPDAIEQPRIAARLAAIITVLHPMFLTIIELRRKDLATPLYPLKMQGIYKTTIWGGQHLRAFGKRDLPDAPIGEVWETAEQTPIANGPLATQPLANAVQLWGAALLGHRAPTNSRFPLLVKLIDANEQLSVQVHPNDAQAAALEGELWGKTEAWYILAATPDAEIVVGTKDCTDREILRQHIANGTMHHRLNHLKVQAGDTVYIPAGRIHALGRGIVAYEVQQQSDITYRLYDWNRTDAHGQPRQLHVDKGLQVTTLDPQPCTFEQPTVQQHDGYTNTTLVTSPYFLMEQLTCTTELAMPANAETFAIYTVLGGSGQLQWGNGQHETLQSGDTWVIPAALGDYRISPATNPLTLMRASLPPTNQQDES